MVKQKQDFLITQLDKEKKTVSGSIKELDLKIERLNIKKYGSKSSGAVLGDILGAVLKKKPKSKK